MTAMLPAQINPHFLYNSFDSINHMIRAGEKRQAIEMINALSSMFRFVSSTHTQLIPLEEEIKYCRQYVSIMEMRFADMIRFSFEIEPLALSFSTMKFIIQPLIENSINHGLRHAGRHGVVTIKAFVADDILHVIVSDDGIGISPQKLELIRETLRHPRQTESIGLQNIHNRIRNQFGSDYGIVIDASLDNGAAVSILQPADSIHKQ